MFGANPLIKTRMQTRIFFSRSYRETFLCIFSRQETSGSRDANLQLDSTLNTNSPAFFRIGHKRVSLLKIWNDSFRTFYT